MKVYLAGVQKSFLNTLPEEAPILLSFAEKNQTKLISELKGRDLVLDSGAFTAWRQDIKIDLDQYISFLKKNKHITACIALDVIGEGSESHLKNLDYMESKNIGVEIWPVFHEGDDFELLNQYVKRGYKKIAIAGTKRRGQSGLLKWVESVFDFEKPGKNIIYHGLAMTQEKVIRSMQNLFDSVDSTTWLAFQKYGFKNNQHLLNDRSEDFLKELGLLAISSLERNPEFLRSLGIMVLSDMKKNPSKLIDIQKLPLFNLEN